MGTGGLGHRRDTFRGTAPDEPDPPTTPAAIHSHRLTGIPGSLATGMREQGDNGGARTEVRAPPGLTRGGQAASGQVMIFVTRPAPTVRPPSRMLNFRPSSMAMDWMSSTVISVLSPGMTISVPSGSLTTPVTSVVRK